MIQRHRTAIRRNKLSRPASLLIEKGILSQETNYFDYGCGHGQDIEILKKNGFSKLGGFDPYYMPDADVVQSDIVNLGYVINVIEDPKERSQVLKKAYGLAGKVLCVSAMLNRQKSYEGEYFSDGVKTSLGTFQKYYEQSELKEYIEDVLKKDVVALHQGIFLVFKHETDRLEYLSRRYRRSVSLEVTRLDPITKKATKVRVFKPKLEELIKESPFFKNVIEFVMEHGRLPSTNESSHYSEMLSEFKSKKKIEALIINNVDAEELKSVKTQRINDLTVMFALMRFSKNGFPKLSDLPESTLLDIKTFFNSYRDFLKIAELLLFTLGNKKEMTKKMGAIAIGKKLPDAIYIHPTYINKLPPEVRVKVGVAQALIGDVDNCNLVKISKSNDKVSFLVYEDFDEVEHPALLYSYVVDIPKAKISEWNYSTRENPPILHRKETFVGADYPLYEKFKSLSDAEESLGLLGHNHIGTLVKWEDFLLNKGLVIIDHQVKKIPAELVAQIKQAELASNLQGH